MILREATIRYKSYDPDKLTKGSHKKICVSCDGCGRIRYVQFCQYRNLCGSCVKSKQLCYKWKGGLVTLVCQYCDKEYKVKQCEVNKSKFCSNKCMGKSHSKNFKGSNNPNWKGGTAYRRDHVLTESACIKLNSRFNNSEFHHITRSFGIYIPKILHRHFYHSLKDGHGMSSMNLLSLQFINGGL